MTKEDVFAAWAPDGFPWSPWVKPVLFAHLELAQSLVLDANCSPLLPRAGDKVALVVDLPGVAGVSTGVALAKRGYRPVPLYNALPLPTRLADGQSVPASAFALLDMVPIISALQAGAGCVVQAQLPPDAPPAFLLDARRRDEGLRPALDQFDNRSYSFVTDFPSAEVLRSHGINRAVLVQRNGLNPQPDLEQTLRRWQDGGIVLERLQLDLGAPPGQFVLEPRPWYRSLLYLIFSLAAPRAHHGTFGYWVGAGG